MRDLVESFKAAQELFHLHFVIYVSQPSNHFPFYLANLGLIDPLKGPVLFMSKIFYFGKRTFKKKKNAF